MDRARKSRLAERKEAFPALPSPLHAPQFPKLESSDSEIVIISGGGANPVLEPSRRPSTSNANSFPAGAGNSLNNGNGSDARAVGARTALKAAASEVIVLDDSVSWFLWTRRRSES